MAYTMLEHSSGNWGFAENSMEAAAVNFLREECTDLRFDADKARQEKESGEYLGKSLGEYRIPYNQQMDVDRLCMEHALVQFLRTGRKEDAFDVYYCYLNMFVGDYKKSRRMIELLSEYEANGSGLLMKHRDHYSHSVYVFALGLALYHTSSGFRESYRAFYGFENKPPRDAACHFLTYWGTTSLFHDIGYPFELPFEQVAAYFEVGGENRTERPYIAYRALEPLTKLDGKTTEKLAELYGTPDAFFSTTDELFAYDLTNKLSGTYLFTKEEMQETLRNKATHPENYSCYMDHAYFSATVLFRKLFCEIGMPLRREHIDALTAILMHNSLYKFSIAHYKTKGVNIPFRAELHPLAWMLMLCDELQCWDRTAYGRDSRRELHPFGCRFELSENAARATYLYDETQEGKVRDFMTRHAQWDAEGRKGKEPKLKAWAGMNSAGDGISDFLSDILKIVNLDTLRLETGWEFAPDQRKRGYLSDSSFLNLYYFTLMVKARGKKPGWENENDRESVFRELPKLLEDTERAFHEDSLEYQLDCIDRTKSYARYMDRIGCFYSDKAVDFPEVEQFDDDEIELLGVLEHHRWLQIHYDMGWVYGDDFGGDKHMRERLRHHQLLIEGYDSAAQPIVPEQLAETHYRETLTEETRLKDKKPMEFILLMMRYLDGVRFYRLKDTKNDERMREQ